MLQKVRNFDIDYNANEEIPDLTDEETIKICDQYFKKLK